jgi:MoxR-like ATPase
MGAEATTSARQTVAEHWVNVDIVGRERIVERIIIARLANGNVLLEAHDAERNSARALTPCVEL